MTVLGKALHRFRGFATGSVNHRILYATAVIVAVSFAVKVAMIVKDSVVAGSFGLGDELDAFLIALVIPTFAMGLLTNSFAAAFMPTYIRLREKEGPDAAKCLFAHVIVVNLCILLACTGVLAATGYSLLKLLASQFSAQKLELAYGAYLILLPSVILDGQLSLWRSALNAGEKFALVAFSPILTPLFIIVVLVVFVAGEGVHINVLAWGTVIGCAAELVVLGFALAYRGLLPMPRWHRKMRSASEVLKQYVPLVASAMIMGSAAVIDQAMASWLDSGSVAALNYGIKIPGILTGIGLTALGTAVLPHFSRLVALGDYAGLKHTLKTYARWIIMLSIPSTILFMACSEWMVKLLFERGAFRAEDTALVAQVQQMYLLQVPFFVLGILGVRALIAMSKNHLLTIMAVVNLVVNVIGNLIFMRWLGVSGIALSTSLVYMISMSMIWWLVARNLSRLQPDKRQTQ